MDERTDSINTFVGTVIGSCMYSGLGPIHSISGTASMGLIGPANICINVGHEGVFVLLLALRVHQEGLYVDSGSGHGISTGTSTVGMITIRCWVCFSWYLLLSCIRTLWCSLLRTGARATIEGDPKAGRTMTMAVAMAPIHNQSSSDDVLQGIQGSCHQRASTIRHSICCSSRVDLDAHSVALRAVREGKGDGVPQVRHVPQVADTLRDDHWQSSSAQEDSGGGRHSA